MSKLKVQDNRIGMLVEQETYTAGYRYIHDFIMGGEYVLDRMLSYKDGLLYRFGPKASFSGRVYYNAKTNTFSFTSTKETYQPKPDLERVVKQAIIKLELCA
jgi:hypothetical protein